MTALRYALILVLVFLPASPFAKTFQVTKTQDTDGDCGPSNCSLREAVEAANTNAGADDIPVPAGTYRLRLGQLTVTGDVEIAGAGQANTIVDGKAKGRVFEILADSTADISGLTIRNGAVSVVPQLGGGILNRGTLTLTDSTLSGNRAIGGTGFPEPSATGGGLYNYGSATLTNTTVTENRSDYWGGGIYNAPTGTLTVSDSTVSDNYARFFSGGIGNYALYDDNGTLNITNSTISGNSVMSTPT